MRSVALAVLAHPSLWPTALAQARRLVPPGWWRSAPYLPLPDRAYWRLRLLTQYGDSRHRAEAADVLNYLRWCREWRRADVSGG